MDIVGIKIKELQKFHDTRGWLSEIHREDEDTLSPKMAYVSYTLAGIIRGPHEHQQQVDFFVFTGPGDFELHLWDNRKASPTFGTHRKLIVGETNQCSVLIPPGIVHGYKAISQPGSLAINLPDTLWKGKNKAEAVDEIRHENDPNSHFKIP